MNGAAQKDPIVVQLFAERGVKARVAKRCGITPQAVGQWTRIPHDRLAEVEDVTGVSRERLRPDLFQS